MGAYWQNRNRNILKNINDEPDDVIANLKEIYSR